MNEDIDQPGFEKSILPKFLDHSSSTDDFLINSMQAYNNQTPQKDSVLEDIENFGNSYIQKCQDEWAVNAGNFLDNNDTIALPTDPKNAPGPIMNGLNNKYPFIDWMVVIAPHSLPDDDGDTAVTTYGIQTKTVLRKNYYPYEPFKTKYPKYFKNDETNLNLVVWGYLRKNNAILKQITHDTFANMRDQEYLNATDKDVSAKDQYNAMTDLAANKDKYAPDAFYIVHLKDDLAIDFGIRYATNNKEMYFATPYIWNKKPLFRRTSGDNFFVSYSLDTDNVKFNGRWGTDLQVAGHMAGHNWVDPFVLVCRISQDGTKL